MVVPHVAVRRQVRHPLPGGGRARRPEGEPGSQSTRPGGKQLRSVAFLENRNPVLQQSDQELSWLFSADVVAQGVEGKPLAEAPMKITPEVPGEFIWKSPAQLVFKPENPWGLDQSFTAELAREFKTFGGETL